MDINPIYYVYAHLHDDGEPYYIGKGKDDRAYRLEDNSRVRILADCLPERTAFIYERILIKHYGRIDLGTGILYNKTDGGEGAAGLVWTEEQREYQRKLSTGRKHTDAAKDKTRASVLALNQTATFVAASCIHCRKVITVGPEAIENSLIQHIYYKHKHIAVQWTDTVVLAPVSCIACKRIIKAADHRFTQHLRTHFITP